MKQSNQPQKKKGGRKPKFDYTSENFLNRISDLAKKGYTDREIALTIGLSEQKFSEKKSGISEISETLSRARSQLNSIVRAAFMKTALGGRIVKTTQYVQKRCECKGKEPDCEICNGSGWITPTQNRVVTETELAPNFNAQHRWLMNYDEDFKKRVLEKNTDKDDESAPRTLTKEEAKELWKDLDKSI